METALRQMQRLEAVGQLTSGVAHDFNNLLTVVLGNISFVERALAKLGVDGKISERLNYMRIAAERGAKLTAQMLAFSRRQKLEPKTVDLNEAVAGMRSSSEPYALLLARTARERFGSTWGVSETGAAGPTGNGYGDAAGHSCIAISGPVETVITLETGESGRIANMQAFAAGALELLKRALA